jgi:hypothetical protein
MTITFKLTPEEIGESYEAFGIEAFIATKLHEFFEFVSVKEMSQEIGQYIYDFIHDKLAKLDLYAMVVIELKYGKKMQANEFIDLATQRDFAVKEVVEMVKEGRVTIDCFVVRNGDDLKGESKVLSE